MIQSYRVHFLLKHFTSTCIYFFSFQFWCCRQKLFLSSKDFELHLPALGYWLISQTILTPFLLHHVKIIGFSNGYAPRAGFLSLKGQGNFAFCKGHFHWKILKSMGQI